MDKQILTTTINDIAARGKGILAADESSPTIAKRFQTINVESTEENRRAYRSLLATTPDLNKYISGVILFEETLGQKTDASNTIPEYLSKQGIVPGIKVDKGLTKLANFPGEKITQGLDDLASRLATYKEQGARFAKWRNVFTISASSPQHLAIRANAEVLARYAAVCQNENIVPIVEPEILMDGAHDLERCAHVTEHVLKTVFSALNMHRVSFEHMILKPNMVIPGKDCADQSSPQAIAQATIEVFRRTVPAAVPSINFLSGGQSSEEATMNLNAINSLGTQPWQLSFSYGRALQEYCLKAWEGKTENSTAAQQILLQRAKFNGAASQGQYSNAMEKATS